MLFRKPSFLSVPSIFFPFSLFPFLFGFLLSFFFSHFSFSFSSLSFSFPSFFFFFFFFFFSFFCLFYFFSFFLSFLFFLFFVYSFSFFYSFLFSILFFFFKFQISVIAVLENLSQLAIGLVNGTVIHYRGDISRDRFAKPKVLHKGTVPITGSLTIRPLSSSSTLHLPPSLFYIPVFFHPSHTHTQTKKQANKQTNKQTLKSIYYPFSQTITLALAKTTIFIF